MSMNREIDLVKVQAFLDEVGVSVEELANYKTDTAESRSKRRAMFAQALDLSAEDLETLSTLLQVLQTTPIVEPALVTEELVDQLAHELLIIRSVQDMLGGRESALRNFVFNSVDFQLEMKGLDPQSDSGSLTSLEYDVRLSKEVSGGKPSLDVDKLKEVLESSQFSAVTNLIEVSTLIYYPDGTKKLDNTRSYEVNEDALQKELVNGNIGIEQLQQATKLSPRKTAFYVRKNKPTEL